MNIEWFFAVILGIISFSFGAYIEKEEQTKNLELHPPIVAIDHRKPSSDHPIRSLTTYDVTTQTDLYWSLYSNSIIEINADIICGWSNYIGYLTSISIHGNGYTMNGWNSFLVFQIDTSSSVIISDLTIQNGTANYGGGMYISNSLVNIINCTITDHYAYYSGGAIYVFSSIFSIQTSNFTSNFASYYGGAVYAVYGTTTIVESDFQSNQAYQGGAVYFYGAVDASLSISDSQFLRNSASSHGGALHLNMGNTTIQSSHLTSNKAIGGDGGGVYTIYSDSKMTDCTFTKNEAFEYGGGAYFEYESVQLLGSDFSENSAVYGAGIASFDNSLDMNFCSLLAHSASVGGATYFESCSVLVNNTDMDSNSATYGGAVYTFLADVSMLRSGFQDNSAYLGGALELDYSTGLFNGVVLTSNDASYGGAVYVYVTDTEIDDTEFTSNIAWADGGAMHSDADSSTSLSRSSLTYNYAVSYGGAIYSYSDVIGLSECTGYGNYASYGGFWYTEFTYGFDFSSCDLYSNEAVYTGGGIYVEWSEGSIMDTMVHDSYADNDYGGGFYSYYTEVAITNASFMRNTAYLYGGGAYFDRGCAVHISRTDFKHNLGWHGGGIYTTYAVFLLDSSTLAHNVAYFNSNGAGIFDYFSESNITNSLFFNNTGAHGGAIYANNNEPMNYITGCNFTSNHAVQSGGAVYFAAGFSFISHNLLSKNSANYGGGIYVNGGSSTTLWLVKNNFTSNHARISGGGVNVKSGTLTLEQATFTANKADSATFEIVSNLNSDCTTIGNCFYSSNFPKNYGNNEECSIRTLGGGTLVVNSFSTEKDYDYVEINGIKYSGSDGPDNVDVGKFDVISWSSNSTVTSQGFEICFEVGANGGAMTIDGGTNTLNHVQFVNNHAVQYGGGLYISSGSLSLSRVTLQQNEAGLGGDEYYFNGGTLSATTLYVPKFDENSFSGSSSSAAVCLSECDVGQHGNCTVASSAPNCYVNCECSNCSVGSASSVLKSTVISDCVSCAAGHVSSTEGASACAACSVGKFATNDVLDFNGGMTKQVVDGATVCNDCPSGYIADNEASFVCMPCPSGRISGAGDWNCSACGIGTTSAAGDAECTACESGKYSSLIASQLCIPCDTSKTSNKGSATCDQAIADHYLLNDVVQNCPDGTNCLGGYFTPIPLSGYWMDRSRSIFTDHAYRCPRVTCTGSRNSSCWTVAAIMNHTCDSDELQCKKGSHAPLCGSCENGYSYSTNELSCVSCSTDSMAGVITIVVIGVVIALVVILKVNKIIQIPSLIWDSYPVLVIRHLFKSGSLKVLISAYQIIQSVTYSMEVVYPKVFSVSLTWFSFLSLDMPGLECSGFDVYDRVFIASLSPIVLAFLVLIAGQIRIFQVRGQKLNQTNRKKKINKINAQHAWFLLFLSYLVVPPVTGKQLKALDCFPFSKTDGANLLRLDTAIDCDSQSHLSFIIADVLLLSVYLSIPMIWLVLLYRKREALWPRGINDESIIVQRRNVETDLIVLRFLFERYRPSMACFESFDICRRILFVGVIPLLAASALLRSAIGLGFALVSMIIYRELTPFDNPDTNLVAYIADIVIYLTYASALLIETGLSNGMNDLTFGLILCAVNFSILITAITAAFFRTLLDKETSLKRKEKYVHIIENACEYSLHKFASTFDVINRTLISPSHCSLIYYGSLQEIKHILRHGIPLSDRYSSEGMLFTMHQPHHLDEFDRMSFPSLEAFVVVSLPRRLLKRFSPSGALDMVYSMETDIDSIQSSNSASDTDFEDTPISTSALWILPQSVLHALRSSYFEDVMDPRLWNEGVVLLPPQCIKRAYQIDRNAFSEEIGFHFTSFGQLFERKTYQIQNDCKTFPLEGNTELTAKQALVRNENVDFSIPLNNPVKVNKISTYLDLMAKVRVHCAEQNLVPIYHYTQVELSSLIIKGGFKMATDGKGDGGVYFSTYGPASYDIGSPHYEENIIIDCFGRERLEELRNRHKVDICMVYAVDPHVVDKVPDTVHHSTMLIPQEYFQDFSLSHPNGHYFLRMDRLLACFHLEAHSNIKGLDNRKRDIEAERVKDNEVTQIMQLVDVNKKQNEALIGAILQEVAPHTHVEWAVTFGATKFNTILNDLEKSFRAPNYKLFYHYGTLAEIEKYVRCGIPVLKDKITVLGGQEHVSTSEVHPQNKAAENTYLNQVSESKGIMFTLHHPDHLSDEEIQLFGNCEAFLTCLLPTRLLFQHKSLPKKSNRYSIREKDAVHKVRSLRRHYSEMSLEESAMLPSDLYYLPTEVLSALRSSYYEKVLDPSPWYHGILLLQPHCIKSAYQISSEENVAIHHICVLDELNCVVDKKFRIASANNPLLERVASSSNSLASVVPVNFDPLLSGSGGSSMDQTLLFGDGSFDSISSNILLNQPSPTIQKVQDFVSVTHLEDKIRALTKQCYEANLVPMYHYTDYQAASIIGRKGFKVSPVGKGGVYFTTHSPTSYDLNSAQFEEKIIIDFLGEAVLEEYRHNHKVDVCVVYAMEVLLMETVSKRKRPQNESDDQVNETSDHLKLLSKDLFKDFSMPHQDDQFYLRPDRVLGCFLLTKNKQMYPQSTSSEKLNNRPMTQLSLPPIHRSRDTPIVKPSDEKKDSGEDSLKTAVFVSKDNKKSSVQSQQPHEVYLLDDFTEATL